MKDIAVTVESILAQMNSLELSTPDQSVEAQEFIKRIKATKREVTAILEEKYSKDIARYKKARSAYDAYTDEKKRLFSKLDSAENILKGKLAAIERERREQMRKAEAAAREAAKAAAEKRDGEELFEEPVSAPPTPQPHPKVDGVSTRSHWTFQIEDESLIPREYLVVDIQKIGQVVRALKENANIPGVKVIEDVIIASR